MHCCIAETRVESKIIFKTSNDRNISLATSNAMAAHENYISRLLLIAVHLPLSLSLSLSLLKNR